MNTSNVHDYILKRSLTEMKGGGIAYDNNA